MCGILLSARLVSGRQTTHTQTGLLTDDYHTKIWGPLCEVTAARGPDSQRTHRTVVECSKDLGGRHSPDGERVALALDFFASELQLRGIAPVVQPHEADADVLCWNGEIFGGIEISNTENDGEKLFQAIRSLESPLSLPDLFGTIEGPYAFVYYHARSQRLFFARDPLGRRSLLIHKPSLRSPYFILASVTAGGEIGRAFEEVLTDSIHCLDLKSWANQGVFDPSIGTIPRVNSTNDVPFARLNAINSSLPPEHYPIPSTAGSISQEMETAVDGLIHHLDESVVLRLRDIPFTALPKGGARVAVLFSGGIDSTIIAYLAHKHLPIDEPIDLLNVAFENPRKVQLQSEGHSEGFATQKKQRVKKEVGSISSPTPYMVPDRVTGLEELKELRRVCPGRVWNFVEVDVPYEESLSLRLTVESLMLPSRTVMDASLALALYFASRGIGKVCRPGETVTQTYHSRARVILNGLGADELLGGYGRHRTAYARGSWEAVIKELQLDIDRIPSRNLGRDDRVTSSHGKETRHPFLSLSFVSYITSLPVHMKLDPRLDLGVGDKMLLRLAAKKMGLMEASIRKKRAMQFGSRSARMEGEKRGDIMLT